MLYLPTLGTNLSGSLGGITASRGRGGAYFRSRVSPVQPGSTFQQTIKTAVGTLAGLWNTTLTQAQRDAWETYAQNVSWTNAIGETVTLTALDMYIRSNVPRIQAGLPRVDAAPTVFDLGGFTAASISELDANNGEVDIAFTNTDDWANEDDAAMLVYVSRQQNPGINFFKGPYRFAGKIDGDSVTAPTSPATLSLPFAAAVGNRMFVRVAVSRADGRYSTSQRMTGLIVSGG